MTNVNFNLGVEKMNPEVKKKWVAALRSGDYVQGKGGLRSSLNHFCCLGVLCNLHAQEHPDFAAKQLDRRTYAGKTSYAGPEVEGWSGISIIAQTALARINDSGNSFDYIAAKIEREL